MIFRRGSFPSKLSFLNSDIDYIISVRNPQEVKIDFIFDITSAYYSRRNKTEKFETPRITLGVICRNSCGYSDLKQYVNKIKENLFYECSNIWLSDLHTKGIDTPERIVDNFLQPCVPYKTEPLEVNWEIIKSNKQPVRYLNGYKI